LQCVLTMARHPQVERLKSDIEEECVLRRLDGSEIAHELCSRLCDISSFSEFLRVDNPVIGLIGSGQSREFIPICLPVEVSAVDDRSAHAGSMAVHIFCR